MEIDRLDVLTVGVAAVLSVLVLGYALVVVQMVLVGLILVVFLWLGVAVGLLARNLLLDE